MQRTEAEQSDHVKRFLVASAPSAQETERPKYIGWSASLNWSDNAKALTAIGAKERKTTYDGQEISEFFVAPVMALELLGNDVQAPRRGDLKVGDIFFAGPRHHEWEVIKEPLPHDRLVCVYAYREKPEPLYHYFYFDPSERIDRKPS